MDFPLPSPAFRREYGKRKWEVAGAQRGPYKFDGIRCGRWPWRGTRPVFREERPATGDAVSVGAFAAPVTGCSHSGETLAESGDADAAGCAHFGEWPRFASVGKSNGDARNRGDRLVAALLPRSPDEIIA